MYVNLKEFKNKLTLIEAIFSLPPDVTHLDMSSMSLGFRTKEELIQVFQALPSTIITLNLSNNFFSEQNQSLLIEIFKRIPHVENLDLSANRLGLFEDKMADVFRMLPPKIIQLNVSNNMFIDSQDRIKRLLNISFSGNIEILDLSHNNLFDANEQELLDFFANLPKTLSILDLSNNSSIGIKRGLLCKIFKLLPPDLAALDLTANYIEYEADLIDIFSVLNLTKTRVTIKDEPITSYLSNPRAIQSSSSQMTKDKIIDTKEQKKAEWFFALTQLKDAADGMCIPYSAVLDKKNQILMPRTKHPSLFQRHIKTTATFVKINGTVYRKYPKSDNISLKQGSFGQVKFLENHMGQRFIAKRLSSIEYCSDINKEYNILLDLDRISGAAKIRDREKIYLVTPYLGRPLSQCLPYNKKQRLELGIDVCIEVDRLHKGLLSRTGTSYAHYDLKPDNITCDDNNKVHLIDFGLAKKHAHEVHPHHGGTPLYAPTEQLPGQQWDAFSLKRILFMPQTINNEQVEEEQATQEFSILTAAMLKEFGLEVLAEEKRVFQGEIFNQYLTAGRLAAILIRARYQLPIRDSQLVSQPVLYQMIIDTYIEDRKNPNLKQILNEMVLNAMVGAGASYNSSSTTTLITPPTHYESQQDPQDILTSQSTQNPQHSLSVSVNSSNSYPTNNVNPIIPVVNPYNQLNYSGLVPNPQFPVPSPFPMNPYGPYLVNNVNPITPIPGLYNQLNYSGLALNPQLPPLIPGPVNLAGSYPVNNASLLTSILGLYNQLNDLAAKAQSLSIPANLSGPYPASNVNPITPTFSHYSQSNSSTLESSIQQVPLSTSVYSTTQSGFLAHSSRLEEDSRGQGVNNVNGFFYNNKNTIQSQQQLNYNFN